MKYLELGPIYCGLDIVEIQYVESFLIDEAPSILYKKILSQVSAVRTVQVGVASSMRVTSSRSPNRIHKVLRR